MPDFPYFRNPDRVLVSGLSPNSIGTELSGMGLTTASGTWVAANRAIFTPFAVTEQLVVTRMWQENGSAVSGNLDLGIYTASGTRLVSSGSVAQAGVSTVQDVNVADTTLMPGLYYLAQVMDNVTGTVIRYSPNAAICRAMGVLQAASAYPLPATVTYALVSSAFYSIVGATTRSFF